MLSPFFSVLSSILLVFKGTFRTQSNIYRPLHHRYLTYFHCPPLKDWLINRFKSSQRKITHPLLFFFYWKEKLREMKRYNELFCEKYVCLTAVRKTILSQYEANYQNLWKRELIWILSSPISKTNIWVEIIWWWRVFDPIFGFYLYLCFL